MMTIKTRTSRVVALVLLSLALLLAGSWPAGLVAADPAGSPGADSGDDRGPVTSVPYQGRLTGSDGQAVADGVYDFTFTLYSAALGGEPLWTETQTAITVQDGYLSVLLGQATPLSMDVVAQDRYLSVAVRGPEDSGFTALEPRQEITSPQAILQQPVCSVTADHNHCGEQWSCSDWGLRVNATFRALEGYASNGYSVWGSSDYFTGAGLVGQNTASDSAPDLALEGPIGTIYSDWDIASSDIVLYSNGDVNVVLDDNGGENANFRIYGQSPVGDPIFRVTDGYGEAVIAATNNEWTTNWNRNQGSGAAVYGESATSTNQAIYGNAIATSGGRVGVRGEVGSTGYGLYTNDSVYAGSGCVNCRSILIVRNTSQETLVLGDVVAVTGVDSILEGQSIPILGARPTQPGDPSVLGVVQSRGEFYAGGDDEMSNGSTVQPVEGDAAPGDYLFIVTTGLAQVRVASGVESLAPGQNLVVADPAGTAGPAAATVPAGSAAGFGQAMEALPDTDGLIWAMINTR